MADTRTDDVRGAREDERALRPRQRRPVPKNFLPNDASFYFFILFTSSSFCCLLLNLFLLLLSLFKPDKRLEADKTESLYYVFHFGRDIENLWG